MRTILAIVVSFLVTFGSAADELAYVGGAETFTPYIGVSGDTLVMAGKSMQLYSLAEPDHPRLLSSLPDFSNDSQYDLLTRDSLVWTAGKSGLTAVDISSPTDPLVLSRTSLCGATGYKLDINGSLAVVGAFVGSLPDRLYHIYIMDISNPATPRILASVGNLPSVQDVVITGEFAYVACKTGDVDGEVYPLDLSNPEQPALGTPVVTGDVLQLERCDDGLAGLIKGELLKISTVSPMSPVVSGRLTFCEYGDPALELAISGSKAWVGREPVNYHDCQGGISEVDLSGSTPVVIRELFDYPGEAGYGHMVIGPDQVCYYIRVYYSVSGPTKYHVHSFNTAAAAPTVNSLMKMSGLANSPVTDGKTLWMYQGDGSGGLLRFDVSRPVHPRLTGFWRRYPSDSKFNVRLVDGDFVYGSGWTTETGWKFQVQTTQNPEVIVGEVLVPYDGTVHFHAKGDNVVALGVVGEENALILVDVTDPSTPAVASTLSDMMILDAVCEGAWLYLLAESDTGTATKVVNISDHANPQEVGSVVLPGGVEHLAMKGGYLYAVDGSTYDTIVHVVDVSNPAHPVLVFTSGDTKYTTGSDQKNIESGNVAVVGEWLIIINGICIELYDISDPALPVFVEYYTGHTYEPRVDLAAAGNHLYLSAFGQALGVWTMLSTSDQIQVPHIAEESDIWDTKLTFVNSGTARAIPYARKLDPDTSESVRVGWFAVNPLGSHTLSVSALAGCAYVVNANPELFTKLVYTNLEPDGGGAAEFWLDDSPATQLDLVLPHYHAAHLTWMGLALMNTEDTEGEATLRAFDDAGVELDEASVSIPPEDRIVGYLEDHFPSVSFVDAARIRVESDHLLAGLTISGNGNKQLLYTPAVIRQQENVLLIPHIAGHVNYWSSLLVVDNTTGTDRTISFTLYSDGIAQGSTQHLVPAGAQTVIPLNGDSAETTADCGVLVGAGDGIIVREAFISNPENGTAEFLLSGETGNHLQFAFPLLNSGGVVDLTWMGLALMNAGHADVTVQLRAYNVSGYVLGQAVHVVKGYDRLVGYADELVPNVSREDVAMILVEADDPSARLCGLNISGHENERLLFTPARALPETPTE